jgi:hypothetical protein
LELTTLPNPCFSKRALPDAPTVVPDPSMFGETAVFPRSVQP